MVRDGATGAQCAYLGDGGRDRELHGGRRVRGPTSGRPRDEMLREAGRPERGMDMHGGGIIRRWRTSCGRCAAGRTISSAMSSKTRSAATTIAYAADEAMLSRKVVTIEDGIVRAIHDPDDGRRQNPQMRER